MIVDDEPVVGRVLTRWLEAEGYDCTLCTNGREAWDALQEREFELVVADIMMPQMDGMELLRRVHEENPRTSVIMVTGLDDRATGIQAMQLGAYGYVIKPFDQNEVLINVAGALERRRLWLQSLDYEHQLEQTVRERTTDIRRAQEEITVRLVSASEYRDEETGEHIRRMALYSAALAEALGWEHDGVADMRLAAPMHDVGKIGISDNILRKPGPLSDQEFDLIKTHTVIGSRILHGSDIPLLEMAEQVARSHHEWWDGSGYPDGLADGDIPPAARLVAVADVYDALVSKRIYADPMPHERALDIMAQEAAAHFDPRVYECFLDIHPTVSEIHEKVADGTDVFHAPPPTAGGSAPAAAPRAS
jgi:putative two-component system response regulator